MNSTLKLISERFLVDLNQPSPVLLNASRWKGLPKLFWKLGCRVGAEIGVSKGRYSKAICVYNPKVKLYCIDPWKAYNGYVENRDDQAGMDNFFCETVKRLEPFNCSIIRKSSMEAVGQFEDGSLDFVFIDGNHSFDYALEDIREWSKKVRVGGIVSGHDYWNSKDESKKTWPKITGEADRVELCQVKDVVNMWVKAEGISPWFLLVGDKCKSWFWVKQ